MAAPFKISFTTKAGLNPHKKPSHSSKSNGEPPAKRPRLLGDEPEEKEETVAITGWDATAGGAIGADGKTEEKGPLVIPALPNRGNWASLGKSKGRDATRSESDKENQKEKTKPEDENYEEEPVSYGLTIMRKSPAPTTRPDDTAEATTSTITHAPETEEDAYLTEEQRLEKRALAALLNPDAAADKTVIPIHPDEEAAFSHDYASAPDAPDLDDYAAVPVEGFGAALLRGMGWKDGEEIGRKRVGGSTTASKNGKKNNEGAKPHEIKRRPEFLGIGAKEDKLVGGRDAAGWGKKGRKDADGEAAGGYQPVVARIKSTGEVMTEEELKARLESQKLVEEGDGGREKDRQREKDKDKERRRDRYDDSSYEEEKRRERKRRERERERDKDRTPDSRASIEDKRRDRDRDGDGDRRRYCDRDGRDSREKRDSRDRDRDRERRKEKERERERDRRRDDYDSYDEERRREKRRERERRDRDRDSDETRKRRREDEVEATDDRKKRYR